jgi:hypothetical protein
MRHRAHRAAQAQAFRLAQRVLEKPVESVRHHAASLLVENEQRGDNIKMAEIN